MKRAKASHTETSSKGVTTGLKTSIRIHKNQKRNNSHRQVHAIDPSFSQVSHTEYMDHNSDIAVKEVNDSAVDIRLDENCGFLDLEEQVPVHPADDMVHSPANDMVHSLADTGSRSNQMAEYEASDKQLAEMTAAADGISSQKDDAHDIYEDEDDIEIERCHINLLDTPKFIIDQMSCCTTPASFINRTIDVDDTISLLDYDLFQDDESVLPDDVLKNLTDNCHDIDMEELPGRKVQSASMENDMKLQQSEKRSARKEVDKEHICTQSYVEDGEDDLVILLSDTEETDSVECTQVKMTPELTSGNLEFATAEQPSQPLCTQQSLDIGNVAVGQREERAELQSFSVQQSASQSNDYDVCILLAPLEHVIEGYRSEAYPMVCTELASSGEKEESLSRKKKPRKQPKIIIDDESKAKKSTIVTDEAVSEDFALRQSTPENHCSPQPHTSVVDCRKEPALFYEAVELPEMTAVLTTNNKSLLQQQNSHKSDR